MASHNRSLAATRVSVPYVVFVTVETTLTDGSKVYDVCLRNAADGSLTDVYYAESEYQSLAIASRLNNAILFDVIGPKTGYAVALKNVDAFDGCPG